MGGGLERDGGPTDREAACGRASLAVSGGYLRGQSRELVFDSATGRRVSGLFWKIDDAIVVGGALALRPVGWLTLTLGGWTPVHDFHFNRMLIFADRGRSMPMVAGEIKASYALTRRLSLSGSFVCQKSFEAKASTTTTHYTTGTIDDDPGPISSPGGRGA